ncbi:MAG: hypothetical protein IJO27_02335 [Bacilli bacterium]|nr:hypothetical protein [Bacteroidaceae bacterium]MBQ6817249.1 hypothetical protein [Bacilli bacterium]
MKSISREEYDNLMAFMEPRIMSLWEHENNERNKQNRTPLDMFQIGFSINDIYHYYIEEDYDFYMIFNGSQLKLIYSTLLKALENHPDKFGTGDAWNILDALYDVDIYQQYNDIKSYIEYLSDHACCYIVYKKGNDFESDILRIDLFRHVKPNEKDNSKYDFIGGLMHTLKHFSIEDKNLSTGKDIFNVFDIHHIIYLIAMEFRLREGSGKKFEAIQKLTNAIMKASFYKEENTGIFFLNTYFKNKSI